MRLWWVNNPSDSLPCRWSTDILLLGGMLWWIYGRPNLRTNINQFRLPGISTYFPQIKIHNTNRAFLGSSECTPNARARSLLEEPKKNWIDQKEEGGINCGQRRCRHARRRRQQIYLIIITSWCQTCQVSWAFSSPFFLSKIKNRTLWQRRRRRMARKENCTIGSISHGTGWSAGGSLVGWLMEIRTALYYWDEWLSPQKGNRWCSVLIHWLGRLARRLKSRAARGWRRGLKNNNFNDSGDRPTGRLIV